jgi:hypothetical protein
MVASPTETPDSITKPKPTDVTAPTDRIVQQAQAGADNLSATSPFRTGKDSTSTSTTDTQVRAASEQMSMGAGIGTTGKPESFQASDGSTIQGQTYTSKDGTFMKVAGGDDGKGSTYQIEQGDNGERKLSKIDSDGNKEQVQLKQQNDNGNRATDATAPQADRSLQQAQQQQPEAYGEKPQPANNEAPPPPRDVSSPEKVATAVAPDSTIHPSKSNSPEASIAAPEKPAAPIAPAGDALAGTPPSVPHGDQSSAPAAPTQLHNEVPQAGSPERIGSGGSGGDYTGGGGDHNDHSGNVDRTNTGRTQGSDHTGSSASDAAPTVTPKPQQVVQGDPAIAAPAPAPKPQSPQVQQGEAAAYSPPAAAKPYNPPADSGYPATHGEPSAGSPQHFDGSSLQHGGDPVTTPRPPVSDAAPVAPVAPLAPVNRFNDNGAGGHDSRERAGTQDAGQTSYQQQQQQIPQGQQLGRPAPIDSNRDPSVHAEAPAPVQPPPSFGSPPANNGGSVRNDLQGKQNEYQKTANNDAFTSGTHSSETAAGYPEQFGQQRGGNQDVNINNRQSLDNAGSTTGLRQPGADAPGAIGKTPVDSFAPTDTAARNGMPSAAAAGQEAAALNAASRAGADNAVNNAAARAGAENAAMLAASRSGSDALAKTTAPTDVLAPTASQNRMLQQAGFNANNPADAAFLASARAQLLATHLGDGANGNATLATALNGANQANLNKLAVLMTGKADATANNVVLNEANMARLNALFKPDALAMQAKMMPLDPKGAAAQGMTDALANRQPALIQMNQNQVYGQLNKLASQLSATEGVQKLAVADLISRNLVRPTDLVAGVGLLANKLETVGPLGAKPTELVSHPENALATANAIAAARARALDVHGEVTPGKPIVLAPHNDLAEGLGLPGGKGLPIDGKLGDKIPDKIADKIADSRIGPETGLAGIKPLVITGAEALLNTKAAADAARANATKNGEGAEGAEGSGLKLPTRKDMAELGDKLDPKKKPEGKGENQGGFSIDGSLLTGAALRLFGDKKDDKTDETKASSKVDETKSQRRKYLIKEGDTLDSIAQEGFGDSKMAVLIAVVNSEVIAQETDPHDLLQVGMSIWLPSEMEVEEFLGSVSTQAVDAADEKLTPEEELARRFGNGWDGSKTSSADAAAQSSNAATQSANVATQADLMTAAVAVVAATAKRRENVEKLLGPLSEKPIDYIKYTVRLGDTLKSVATKHPALKDVSLWELVASVNDIQVPGNNASAVKLTRGSSLRLPTAAEIDEFRNANANKKPIGNGPKTGPRTGGTTGARSIVIPPGNPLANTILEKQDSKIVDEHAVTRASAPIRDAGASLLRAGGFVKDQPKTHDDATIVTSPLEKLPRPEISKPITTDKPSVENIKNLSEDCRVVRRHQVDATGRLYQAQLEVLRDGVWNSVMMYNISDGNCWRKSINELGVTEILQLDLPTAAIHQMLESDFANNWEEYRDRVLSTANAY